MKIYKILNIISSPIKILMIAIIYPVKLFFLVPFLIIGFFDTDWEDAQSRKYYYNSLKWCIYPTRKMFELN